MANLSIVIVPAKKLSNGRHRVRIAVAHRSQTRYISTQFILDSANQMKNGRVVKHENAANINACLRKLINEYEEILSSIHYQSNISCTELIHVITREQQKKGITFNTEGGNLAASKIRNLECPSYEICLIDYGCGKFNRKIHIMEQYP